MLSNREYRSEWMHAQDLALRHRCSTQQVIKLCRKAKNIGLQVRKRSLVAGKTARVEINVEDFERVMEHLGLQRDRFLSKAKPPKLMDGSQ